MIEICESPVWCYVAVTMRVLDVRYKEWTVQKHLYAVRVDVSPLTQESDIVAAMGPLLNPLGVVCCFDKVILLPRYQTWMQMMCLQMVCLVAFLSLLCLSPLRKQRRTW